ncbi:hypothetical protein GCM10009603_35900 [Nocardiopsis exhalans]
MKEERKEVRKIVRKTVRKNQRSDQVTQGKHEIQVRTGDGGSEYVKRAEAAPYRAGSG